MTKVVTYGTYDLLHFGHISLLKRARTLGDYLIVGVTADDFDKTRGKINVHQSLMERVEAVRQTGIADEIIIEEYEGQKIDDIRRYDIDIFTVGSDWIGKFDYLNEYCKVIYLDRTQGVSSSELRSRRRLLRVGFIGESLLLCKYLNESRVVNGIEVTGVCTKDKIVRTKVLNEKVDCVSDWYELLERIDAVYIASVPSMHYKQIKAALQMGKHVLCESPIALAKNECDELFELAATKKLVLMESIKTAYSTAYNRLLLLVKSGKIGKVISVDAVCTSLRKIDPDDIENYANMWNSICAWGPTAMLPIFQMLGTDYKRKTIVSHYVDEKKKFDAFTKVDFVYGDAVASFKVGKGVKSEGELIVSGTEGYVYVPAPWWKTDYFEIRYENAENNQRYFYQLDGEGIRYEVVAFTKAIETGKNFTYIDRKTSDAISSLIESFYCGSDVIKI